jgi:uroporphyrinogen-III synthase
MQPPLLILRPEPGATATHAAAAALGLVAERFPLFHTAPHPWDAPAPESFDALLIGSANALRHGGPQLAAYAGKPAYCVGQATARAAQALGLSVAAIGEGGLQSLLDQMPAPRRLLRLTGETHLPLTAPEGTVITSAITYAAHRQPLPEALARLLLAHALPAAIALFHSGEAARHFAAETDRLAIPRAKIHAITIGPRVTAIAEKSGHWASLHTAPAPTDAAMLALAQQMCQNRAMTDRTNGAA